MNFNTIKHYWRCLTMSPVKHARKLGMRVGKNVYLATRCFGSEPYLITIGDNVQVTYGVKFYTHGGGNVIRRFIPDFDAFGKIEIKDHAYVGADTIICPGVTIGQGSLIAAGSVVTRSVPDGEVWGEVPARFISTVEDYRDRNLKYNIHTKGLSPKQKREILLSLPDDRFIKK